MKLLIFSFLLLIAIGCNTTKEKRILFIGNSYTYRNNMPFIFHQICERKGKKVYVEHITKGKYTFYLQSKRKRLQHALAEDGKWDLIVIQGSSRDLLKSQKILKTKTYPAIKRLLKRIRQHQPRAKVYFYMTWPYKYGYRKLQRANTRTKMQKELLEGYTQLKKRFELPVVPVGELWYSFQKEHPEINLYTRDRSHPSLAGSYLTASAFYTVLFGQSVGNMNYHTLLRPTVASELRKSSSDLLINKDYTKWFN